MTPMRSATRNGCRTASAACDNRGMSRDFDAVFQEHTREMQSDAARDRADDDVDDERRAAWKRYVDALTVALQPVADAATAHGHQATVSVLPNQSVEFEIRFCEQFLPQKLDEAATETLVRGLVAQHGLAGQGAKATGKLMGLLMKEHKDSVDSEIAKGVVQRVLAEG